MMAGVARENTILGLAARSFGVLSLVTAIASGADWSGYRWAVIGDSLSDPRLAPVGGKYYDIIVRETGIQTYVDAVGGTGYWRGEEDCKAFYQRLEKLPSDVDIVTVFGTVNDWKYYQNRAVNRQIGLPTDKLSETNTVSAFMNEAIDVISRRAPKARLVLVGSLYYFGVGSKYHNNVNEALKAIAKARGVEFHDLYAARPDDPLDFRNINPQMPGGSVGFAKKYTRDYREKGGYGHPSAAYNQEYLAPVFLKILGNHLGTAVLGDVP